MYPTEFFYFNASALNSAVFIYQSVPLVNFTTSASFVNNNGSVPFPVDEKEALATIIPICSLMLTNEVVYRATYTVIFEVVWHSLPYGHPGGRTYSHMGTITYQIKTIQMALTCDTSNPITLNRDLQLQEIVFCNTTITFPEVNKLDG